jgi:hypothetical protein
MRFRFLVPIFLAGTVAAGGAQASGGPTTAPAETKTPKTLFDFGLEPLNGVDTGEETDAPQTKKTGPTAPAPNTSKSKDGASSSPPEKGLLDGCHISADGIATVDKSMTFGLRGTEGKDFVISGELYPSKKNYGGFKLWLRQRNATHRYSLTLGGLQVKRLLLEGKTVPKFATPIHFDGLASGQWHTFKVEVTKEAIYFYVDDLRGAAMGPLETSGKNLLVLYPGAQLKGLKVEIHDGDAPAK